jgi:hypothetical protein
MSLQVTGFSCGRRFRTLPCAAAIEGAGAGANDMPHRIMLSLKCPITASRTFSEKIMVLFLNRS